MYSKLTILRNTIRNVREDKRTDNYSDNVIHHNQMQKIHTHDELTINRTLEELTFAPVLAITGHVPVVSSNISTSGVKSTHGRLVKVLIAALLCSSTAWATR